MGGIKNGALLKLIEQEGFQVFLTGDKNMQNQQLKGQPFAVLIMSAINWPVVKPHVEMIYAAIDEAAVGTVQLIDCGVFTPQKRKGPKPVLQRFCPSQITEPPPDPLP